MTSFRFTVWIIAPVVLAALAYSANATPHYTLTTLASFDGTNGSEPYADLIFDSSGNLYGTTSRGGAYGVGTVFRLDPTSGALTTLAAFDGANGSEPRAGLIFDSSGKLYGTTNRGGALFDGTYGSGYGTAFQIDSASGALTTLVSFEYTNNGSQPFGDLIFDSSGNLYGTTAVGGGASFGDYSVGGTLFRLDPTSGALTTLFKFPGFADLLAGLVSDANGNLYGTTSKGHGTVFRFDPTSGVLTTLASFNGANGSSPSAGLIFDSSGNLYGTTVRGGTLFNGSLYSGYGTVFRVDPTSGVLTTLASFNGANGSEPRAGLIFDSSGNLYGTTAGGGVLAGGAGGYGTVFRVDPANALLTTLVSFDGANDHGGNPFAGLISDASGNLYGTTAFGGAFGRGTVFKLAPVVPEPTSILLLSTVLMTSSLARPRRLTF